MVLCLVFWFSSSGYCGRVITLLLLQLCLGLPLHNYLVTVVIAQLFSLRNNVDKSLVMTTDGSQIKVHLSGVLTEWVKEFKYNCYTWDHLYRRKNCIHHQNPQKDWSGNSMLPLIENQHLSPSRPKTTCSNN